MWNYDHKHTYILVIYTKRLLSQQLQQILKTSVKCNTPGPSTRSLPTDVKFINIFHKTHKVSVFGSENETDAGYLVTSATPTIILSGTPSYSRTAQSIWRLTTGWKVRSSILGGTRDFLFVKTRPDRPWLPGSSRR